MGDNLKVKTFLLLIISLSLLLTACEKDEKICNTDADCACGIHAKKGNCFYGNSKYVDPFSECPDFCNGITGKLELKCENNKCIQKAIETNNCNFQNCHGLDLKCGTNPPAMCTMEYQAGDKCRKYAKCIKSSTNSCSLVLNDEFNQCKSCVEKCMESDDMINCEKDC